MDENIQQKMDEEIESELKKLDSLTPGSKEYTEAANALTTLYKARLDEVKIQNDAKDKADRREMEDMQHSDELVFKQHDMEADDERRKEDKLHRWIDSGVKVLGVLVPSLLYAYFGVKGMKFEETGTVTSFFNKQNLGQIFRFRK